jgi:hypothetical protein
VSRHWRWRRNPAAPGEPTLRGWLRAMIDRIVVLAARLEELESRAQVE